jgi:hypothetical protein
LLEPTRDDEGLICSRGDTSAELCGESDAPFVVHRIGIPPLERRHETVPSEVPDFIGKKLPHIPHFSPRGMEIYGIGYQSQVQKS